MSLKLYLTALLYRSLFPLVANYEGRRKDKLVDWAEGTGRTEDLMEWRKEQREEERSGGTTGSRRRQKRKRHGKKRSRQRAGSLSRLNFVNVAQGRSCTITSSALRDVCWKMATDGEGEMDGWMPASSSAEDEVS